MSEVPDEFENQVEKVDEMLRRLLAETRPVLTLDDAEFIDDLIFGGERQIALETLVGGLEHAKCEIDRSLLERLRGVAELMGSNDDTLFKFLEKKVRD